MHRENYESELKRLVEKIQQLEQTKQQLTTRAIEIQGVLKHLSEVENANNKQATETKN